MRGSRRNETDRSSVSALLVAALAAVVVVACAVPSNGEGFPRVANIYWGGLWNADPDRLEKLAEYDFLVLHSANGYLGVDEIATLRDLHPDIVMIPHMPFSYHSGVPGSSPHMEAYLDALNEHNWWLRDTAGEIAWLPEGAGLVNMTTNCPTNDQGQRLCDWFGDFLADHLGPGGPWDGIYLDLCIDDIRWAMGLLEIDIDSDLDGVVDDPYELYLAWREGTAIAATRLRQRVGADYVLVSGGANTLFDQLNGANFESFPESHGGWYWSITDPVNGYVAVDSLYREPRYNMLTVNWYLPVGDDGPHWAGYFIKKFLFTLASTLVFGDGYYAIASPGYCDIWWYPYFDLELGGALGSAEDAVAFPGDAPGVEYADMIKIRRFASGVAAVNPTNVTQEVELPGEYYDPEAWNGHFHPLSSTMTSVDMSSKMGRVLVGSGAVREETATLSVELTDGGALIEWTGPWWAAEYALYKRRVRGDDSLGPPELVTVTDETTFLDTHLEPGRQYAYSVSGIDALDCEGRACEPVVLSMESGPDLWVVVMIEEPGEFILLSWIPPNVPGELIFELERVGEKGGRDWLARFHGVAGEVLTYRDVTAEPGRLYRYELFQVLDGGRRLIGTARARAPEQERGRTALLGCLPQPARDGSVVVHFRLGDDDNWDDLRRVTLSIYDIRGRVVRRLLDASMPPGDHSVVWDCRDDDGHPVASGCYLTALDVAGATLTGKVLVLR